MATSSRPVQSTPESSSQASKSQQLLSMLAGGYMISAALYVVARYKIADLLADGPLPVSVLATKTGANADALYRILRALTSPGIFEESSARTFALTAVSEHLISTRPNSMYDMVRWMTNQFHFEVWGHMMLSAQTGTPAVEHIYKKPCFEVFEPGSEVAKEFNHAMTNLCMATAPAVLDAYDFTGINSLVDIGGGHGYFITQILKHYPAMRGILFDMESIVEEAKSRIDSDGFSFRLQAIGGNFFQSVPAGADAYMMQHIIHDWEDEKALIILKNIHQALNGTGKLLVLESIVKPGAVNDFTPWLDLEMLLMPGGRERTEAEFRELFARAGFRLTRVVPTPSMVSVLEAVPV